jgi:hypothetical protein
MTGAMILTGEVFKMHLTEVAVDAHPQIHAVLDKEIVIQIQTAFQD